MTVFCRLSVSVSAFGIALATVACGSSPDTRHLNSVQVKPNIVISPQPAQTSAPTNPPPSIPAPTTPPPPSNPVPANPPAPNPAPSKPASSVPVFNHVFFLLEENHSYSSVIGSSSMPYLNSLVSQYGLATDYYANTHPSIGNYFMLTTGQIITNDDGYNKTVTADNLVRHFISGAKTWKVYAESLPSVGYTGWDAYPYVKHHNPFAYFSDVVNSSSEKDNLVQFSQLSSDLKNNQLPEFGYIVPNMLDDAHDGSLSKADSWLKTNVAPLISNSSFQQSGLLIIVFDESTTSDTQHGGGHVAMLVISPKAKKDYKSTTFYQHQSTCRLVLQGLGLTSFPSSCSSAPQMGEFF